MKFISILFEENFAEKLDKLDACLLSWQRRLFPFQTLFQLFGLSGFHFTGDCVWLLKEEEKNAARGFHCLFILRIRKVYIGSRLNDYQPTQTVYSFNS